MIVGNFTSTGGSRATARQVAVWVLWLSLGLVACSQSRSFDKPDLDPVDEPTTEPGDDEPGDAPEPPGFPDTGINATVLTVTGVNPDTGPFSGGNRAIVRGSGFTEDAIVRIGGRMVQPADTLLENRNSLSIVVPAGEVGPADVEVEVGEESAVREDAYLYNPLQIDPAAGSVAGGTSVVITVSGATLSDGVEVLFGEPGAEAACRDVRVVTPSELRCLTPPGSLGEIDVRVVWPEGEYDQLLAVDAYRYENLIDTNRGGLSGGPIQGTVNVTVVDSQGGRVVREAFVLLGDDPGGPYQGLTDGRGQITFSGTDLEGPVTIHVAAVCFERGSIVAFDAQNVTVFVRPLLDPTCGEPGDPPEGGRGAAGSLISGELIFPGSDEFAVNSWDVVPPPRDDEVRVAYVFTTQASITSRNPNPAIPGTTSRVLEATSPLGDRGFPYRIFARPAGLAVYALSGLERRATGEFVPYVMGVARDIITSPGDETTGVDIVMDIPLDRELTLSLKDLPAGTPRGPDQYRVEAHVDLGGEGVIVRRPGGQLLDVVTSFTSGNLFRFFAQPALVGSLDDGSYQVVAGWYTDGSDDTPPYTEVRLRGVPQADDVFPIDGFLAIPGGATPAEGQRVPDDRILRWENDGPTPDMHVVSIIGGDGLPAWTQVVPGDMNQSPIPDFTTVGLDDIAPGFIFWTVRAVRIEDFVYDQFQYNLLSSRYWTHTAVDSFTMQR